MIDEIGGVDTNFFKKSNAYFMGFEATLSYNLPQINPFGWGGLRTFFAFLCKYWGIPAYWWGGFFSE
jgi:hypothetical protein